MAPERLDPSCSVATRLRAASGWGLGVRGEFQQQRYVRPVGELGLARLASPKYVRRAALAAGRVARIVGVLQ